MIMRDLGPPSPNTTQALCMAHGGHSNGETPLHRSLHSQEPTAPAPSDAGAGSVGSKQNNRILEPRVGAATSVTSQGGMQSTAGTTSQLQHREQQQQHPVFSGDMPSPVTSSTARLTGGNVSSESEAAAATGAAVVMGGVLRASGNVQVAKKRMGPRESGANYLSEGVGNRNKPNLHFQPQQAPSHIISYGNGARVSGNTGGNPSPSLPQQQLQQPLHCQQHPHQAHNLSDLPGRLDKRDKQQAREMRKKSQVARTLVLAPTTSRYQEQHHLIGGEGGAGWLVDSSGRRVAPANADDTDAIVPMRLSRVPKSLLPLPKAVSSGTPVLYPKQCFVCGERVSARLGEPVLLREERHEEGVLKCVGGDVGVGVTSPPTPPELNPQPKQQRHNRQLRQVHGAGGVSTVGSTWRLRERTKTFDVGIILCLNIGERHPVTLSFVYDNLLRRSSVLIGRDLNFLLYFPYISHHFIFSLLYLREQH